jgi:hypothetical protein
MPDRAPGGPQLPRQPLRVGGRFDVEGHRPRARFGVCRSPPVRVGDHEVAVDGDRADPQQRLDHGQSEGEVGDEMVVHDVDVRPVGIGHGIQLALQVGEIGGQDARRDLHDRHPMGRLVTA